MTVIGVTGTSGKSTTVELIHYLLQNSGVKTGSISGIQFNIGEKSMHNGTLRTSLRPWHMQKLLRQMVRAKCEFAVIEVSSHALDQNRLWGVAIDTAVLTNIYDLEHLDYHGSFAEYVRSKAKLFRSLNTSYRKPGVPKVSILNRDDDNYEVFQ
jgi:UDP-N-acetylmuramoyl-L-alanyl-D-glutamate--2,6-diaminopimelate ligase